MRHVLAFLKKSEKSQNRSYGNQNLTQKVSDNLPLVSKKVIDYICSNLRTFNVLNMSHENGSSAFVFQVMGILKPRKVSTDKGLQLSLIDGRLQLTLWFKF